MSGSGEESTHRTIERVARESYGRLVAYLSSHTRDVGSAEGALAVIRSAVPAVACPTRQHTAMLMLKLAPLNRTCTNFGRLAVLHTDCTNAPTAPITAVIG